VKLLNRRISYLRILKVCSICHKISASNEDHLDCQQKRRVELEDENLKQSLPERFDAAKNVDDLGIELKAILEHMTKEKEKKLQPFF
jgi:hypothetical protein